MRPGETRAIEVMQETRSFLVPTAAIPKHQQWALERSMELLDKAKDIIASEMPPGDGKREAQALAHGRDGDRARHREAVVPVPAIMEGCGPMGCPRPAHGGLEHEATLIKKDQDAALARPPKACAPALPAQRTPERRGARASVWEAAPVKRWLSVERWLHRRRSLARSFCQYV
jgi:hypothetical protein